MSPYPDCIACVSSTGISAADLGTPRCCGCWPGEAASSGCRRRVAVLRWGSTRSVHWCSGAAGFGRRLQEERGQSSAKAFRARVEAMSSAETTPVDDWALVPSNNRHFVARSSAPVGRTNIFLWSNQGTCPPNWGRSHSGRSSHRRICLYPPLCHSMWIVYSQNRSSSGINNLWS